MQFLAHLAKTAILTGTLNPVIAVDVLSVWALGVVVVNGWVFVF